MGDICVDCGTSYDLEEGEVCFFSKRGLELPKRCYSCRAVRKEIQDKKIICQKCEKPFIVPKEVFLFARSYPDFKVPVICIGGCGRIKFDVKHIPTSFERIILKIFGLERTREILGKTSLEPKPPPSLPKIHGFQNCSAINTHTLTGFLINTFPEKVLKEITSISYTGKAFIIERKDKRFIERGNLIFINEKTPVAILVNCQNNQKHDNIDEIKWTICHEFGHLVYKKFLAEEKKAEWYMFFKDQYEYFTREGEKDDKEYFAECFAGHYLNVNKFNMQLSSQKKEFIKSIIEKLKS